MNSNTNMHSVHMHAHFHFQQQANAARSLEDTKEEGKKEKEKHWCVPSLLQMSN